MAETKYFRKGFGMRAEVHKDVEREFDWSGETGS